MRVDAQYRGTRSQRLALGRCDQRGGRICIQPLRRSRWTGDGQPPQNHGADRGMRQDAAAAFLTSGLGDFGNSNPSPKGFAENDSVGTIKHRAILKLPILLVNSKDWGCQ